MRQRLTIGLLQPQPGWILLLQQLGVAFERVGMLESVTPQTHGAIIINRSVGSGEAAMIEEYLRNGGAVLDTGGYMQYVGGSTSRSHKRSIVPSNDDRLFTDAWIIDLYSSIRTHRDAQYLKKTLFFDHVGSGALAWLGFDINRLMIDRRSTRKQFAAPGRSFPDEIVATVSKGELRQMVGNILRRLFTERGLPWVRLWQFPNDAPTLFAYRIDSDYGSQSQIQSLYDVASSYGISMSWFLHVEPHADWLGLFNSFHNQEIGVHAYRHRTFRGYDANFANIGEAKHLLEQNGLATAGYAAPNGVWHPALAQAIEDHGFDYSSEFSLDYDDLPFYPWVRHRFSSVLQVPVHPVSIGSLTRSKTTDNGMKHYFRIMIDRCLLRNEPAFFYHHPGHEHFDVMADTFAYARDRALENITLGDYARWWRRRTDVRYTVDAEGHMLAIQSDGRPHDLFFCIDHPEGRRGFVRNDGQTSLCDITWQELEHTQISAPGDIRATRAFNLHMIQHVIEDFNYRIRQ